MPRHHLPGIGEQVPLFVALPSSLPVEGYVADQVLVQQSRIDDGLNQETDFSFKLSVFVSDKVYRKAGCGANVQVFPIAVV
jgi:hypothetical protein